MTESAAGDLGAFMPWIMLYGGGLAFLVARGAAIAPFAAAAVTTVTVVTRMVKTETIVSTLGLLTLSALLVADALAWLSLKACIDLHREVPGEVGQPT